MRLLLTKTATRRRAGNAPVDATASAEGVGKEPYTVTPRAAVFIAMARAARRSMPSDRHVASS